MVETLSGTVTSTTPQGIILKTGPVEWELMASTRTIRTVGGTENRDVRLYTHLTVREDDLRLYAFSSQAERAVFRSLLGVSGIGPKQALKILSFSEPGEFSRMVEAADVQALGKLPGIGTKTAQKMVLALQGQLVIQNTDTPAQDQFSEIVESLVSMGFDRSIVRSVVQKCTSTINDGSKSMREMEQDIFRSSLLQLSAQESGS